MYRIQQKIMTDSIPKNFFPTQNRISTNSKSIRIWRRKYHGTSTRLVDIDQME